MELFLGAVGSWASFRYGSWHLGEHELDDEAEAGGVEGHEDEEVDDHRDHCEGRQLLQPGGGHAVTCGGDCHGSGGCRNGETLVHVVLRMVVVYLV